MSYEKLEHPPIDFPSRACDTFIRGHLCVLSKTRHDVESGGVPLPAIRPHSRRCDSAFQVPTPIRTGTLLVRLCRWRATRENREIQVAPSVSPSCVPARCRPESRLEVCVGKSACSCTPLSKMFPRSRCRRRVHSTARRDKLARKVLT